MVKIIPNITKKISVMVLVAAANCGLRKKRRSSMGSGVRSSQAANANKMTTATQNDSSVAPDSQPRVGASMMA